MLGGLQGAAEAGEVCQRHRADQRMFQGGAGDLEVEIPRAELAAILLDAARNGTEFLWGDTITSLEDDGTGVAVTIAGAASRRFDLVVGADGLHSVTRHLTFGPEQALLRHMGMYVATLRIGEPPGCQDAAAAHPGRHPHPQCRRARDAGGIRPAPGEGFGRPVAR